MCSTTKYGGGNFSADTKESVENEICGQIGTNNFNKEFLVHRHGLGDPTFYEKPAITGTVYTQIRKALEQLQSVVLKEQIYKLPDRAESRRVWNYPLRALEESVSNALLCKYVHNKAYGNSNLT